jgi:preprotein translocase subunit SecE
VAGGDAQRVTYHLRDTEEGEVAESKRRRGKDAEDDDLDEVIVDAVDDDALTDADEDDEEEEELPVTRRRGGTATKTKAKPDSEAADKAVKVKSEDRVGLFGRLFRFFREVVAELRKVIWPTRKELLTYATVVVVFVAVILTIVGLLDTGFAWAVLHVFGGGKK